MDRKTFADELGLKDQAVANLIQRGSDLHDHPKVCARLLERLGIRPESIKPNAWQRPRALNFEPADTKWIAAWRSSDPGEGKPLVRLARRAFLASRKMNWLHQRCLSRKSSGKPDLVPVGPAKKKRGRPVKGGQSEIQYVDRFSKECPAAMLFHGYTEGDPIVSKDEILWAVRSFKLLEYQRFFPECDRILQFKCELTFAGDHGPVMTGIEFEVE